MFIGRLRQTARYRGPFKGWDKLGDTEVHWKAGTNWEIERSIKRLGPTGRYRGSFEGWDKMRDTGVH